MRKLLFLITALIVYGSLYPWEFHFAEGPANPLAVLLGSWPPLWDRFAFRDAAVNVAMYLPFGAIALWALDRRFPRALGIAPVLLAALVLSTSMELLQVYVPHRVSSIFDILCNVAGAFAGILVALIYHPAALRRRAAISMAPAPLFLLALFGGYELYPFFPVFSITRLAQHVEELLRPATVQPHEIACCAAEWFAAMLVARAILKGKLAPPMVLLCLPLRLVIFTRSESVHEVLGGALAWLAWILVRDAVRLRAGLWLMAAAILVRELAPFHLMASNPTPFSWLPFTPSFDSERGAALVILLRKAFDYGALVWLMAQHRMSIWRAGAIAAAALLVLEGVQRYLPGRTPEITDSALTLLVTLVLWVLNNFQRRQGLA